MQAVEHQGFGLKYLTVVPDGYSPETTYPLIIMLHGFGANMQDLAGMAPMINQHGYVYACPNAPLAFDLGGGHAGWGWMAPRGMSTPEQVQSAEDLLGGFFDEVFEQFKTEPGKAVLLGFSQGGGMTYRCGLERPTAFAGLVALSANPAGRGTAGSKTSPGAQAGYLRRPRPVRPDDCGGPSPGSQEFPGKLRVLPGISRIRNGARDKRRGVERPGAVVGPGVASVGSAARLTVATSRTHENRNHPKWPLVVFDPGHDPVDFDLQKRHVSPGPIAPWRILGRAPGRHT